MNFKSLPQLLDRFKNEEICIAYYENLRWEKKPFCPFCQSYKPYKTNRGYKCSNTDCKKKFTVKIGTIFENSKIPMRTWFIAIYLCTAHKKGISSLQLSTDLGITQKTAWFMLHRIREMLKSQTPAILNENTEGIVEVDETYVGGKNKNKHKKRKESIDNPGFRNDGKPFKKKSVVIGLIERDGKVVLKHISNAQKENMVPVIHEHIPIDTTVFTDEHQSFTKLRIAYNHSTVNHSLKIYVDGEVHTNTIENFWSVLKRGLYGIYHQVSEKHLNRYLDEFSARFNTRVLNADDRMEEFLLRSDGGLLYKNLIGKYDSDQ